MCFFEDTRGRRRRRRNWQCSQFFQLLVWPRNPSLSQRQSHPRLSWVIGKEWDSGTSDAELEHIIQFITKGTAWPGVFVLTQSCPFPPWFNSSPLQQSTSDVCQQPVRVAYNAFPFPRHKHIRNVESFGSKMGCKFTVCPEVGASLLSYIWKDLTPWDDRWTYADHESWREVLPYGLQPEGHQKNKIFYYSSCLPNKKGSF